MLNDLPFILVQHQNRCFLKKEKNILAYGVEDGDSSRARGKRPPVTEYAVKYVFWRRAFILLKLNNQTNNDTR